jgi:hypothetical protein
LRFNEEFLTTSTSDQPTVFAARHATILGCSLFLS